MGIPGWFYPNGSTSQPTITDAFGMRVHPIYGDYRLHGGTDMVGFSEVKSVADGTVIRAGYFGGAGNWVQVQHPGGPVSGYKHLDRIDVGYGQRVDATQRLGIMGTTGDSTGVHLHFEIQMLVGADLIDPIPFLVARVAPSGGSGLPGGATPGTTPSKGRKRMLQVHGFTTGPSVAFIYDPVLDKRTGVLNARQLELAKYAGIPGIGVAQALLDGMPYGLEAALTEQSSDQAAIIKAIKDTLADADIDVPPVDDATAAKIATKLRAALVADFDAVPTAQEMADAVVVEFGDRADGVNDGK